MLLPFLFAFIASVWLISLCKILCFSTTTTVGDAFFPGLKRGEHKRNVLIVVAHPDDESMFFSPTLLFFITEGHNVHILCLSTGDADGKGEVRKQEIFRACATLKVPIQNITVLDDPRLQDGFHNPWDHQYMAYIIKEHVNNRDIDLIISFDNYGVSGHRNHCDVHHGVCKYLSENSERHVKAWELVSINILRKYSGPLEVGLSTLCGILERSCCCLVNSHPQKSYRAMAEHDSQWVWFRKLFVLFSSYTYVNTLRRISL